MRDARHRATVRRCAAARAPLFRADEVAHVPGSTRDLRHRRARSRSRSGTGVMRPGVVALPPPARPAGAAVPAAPIHPFGQVFAPTSRSQTLSPPGPADRPLMVNHMPPRGPCGQVGVNPKRPLNCVKNLLTPPLGIRQFVWADGDATTFSGRSGGNTISFTGRAKSGPDVAGASAAEVTCCRLIPSAPRRQDAPKGAPRKTGQGWGR